MRSFKLPGASGRLVVDTSIKGFVKSKKISEHIRDILLTQAIQISLLMIMEIE